MKHSKYAPRAGRGRFGVASFSTLVALFSAGLLVVLVAGAQAATPTPVLLGTAGDFAVLAGSGITNTGASTIDGDVGSSPTSSQTGFAACPGANCVALTGANHTDPDPNDTATQNAKADLTTAYNNAAGQTPAEVPTELAGQTLPAGVYNSASGTFGMSGTLVLDGENNPDAIFIFQTATTLITGGTGNVSLIRGAQSCNIFWKVGSAATLGAGSTFRGTILAHDDISLGDGVTVDGRLLAGAQASGAGAVTLIHDTIARPSCAIPATTTPAPDTTPATTPEPTTTTAPSPTPAPSFAPAPAPRPRTTATRAAAEAAKAKAARVEAAKAKAASAKAATAARTAKAAKARAAARGATSTRSHGFARPARRHVGLTG